MRQLFLPYVRPFTVIEALLTQPQVVGNGMTIAILNLGPCSMLPPHYHPRAANFVVAVSGTTDTFMIGENGARTVRTTLTPGKMTIFPLASLHMMQNTGMFYVRMVFLSWAISRPHMICTVLPVVVVLLPYFRVSYLLRLCTTHEGSRYPS